MQCLSTPMIKGDINQKGKKGENDFEKDVIYLQSTCGKREDKELTF